jgi:hypothetical protein
MEDPECSPHQILHPATPRKGWNWKSDVNAVYCCEVSFFPYPAIGGGNTLSQHVAIIYV